MKFIESKSTNPFFNLALEEYVFEKLDKSQQYFILWQNYNTIVIGKYQNTMEEINQDYVDEHNINIARRLSGGGAVYHDSGNLNYTFITDQTDTMDFNFNVFIQPVTAALAQFNITAEFTGRNDVTIDGKKFSGSSQYAKGNRVMHHGCIMVDSNLNNVTNALKPKAAKFDSKSTKSVASRVTTIRQHGDISVEQFKKSLKDQVFKGNTIEEYVLSQSDIQNINQLAEEKYATWEWNYGKSPSYDMQRERKYDFGLVTVYLSASNGVISDIKFYGDFFGNGDISQLEQAIIGEKIDGNFAHRLNEKIDLGHYIKGMTCEEMQALLR
ncbi:lipoate-protein ligase A [Clostridiales Family XIII bacterium PM5-7]